MIDSRDILVTRIQRFSLQDGPGIRTTVFLKGCSVCCPWCCNPENIEMREQGYIKDGRKGIYGRWYNEKELYGEIIKDEAFYGKKLDDYSVEKYEQLRLLPGGVTFSGGEPLTQLGKMIGLCRTLRNDRIHIAIETSLFVPEKEVRNAISIIDLFYVDVKILDNSKCRQILKGNLEQYKQNFSIIMESRKPVVLRIPVIKGYTDDLKNRKLMSEFISKANGNIIKIELLKEHNLGLSKYESLIDAQERVKKPEYRGLDDSEIEEYRGELQIGVSIPIEICKI